MRPTSVVVVASLLLLPLLATADSAAPRAGRKAATTPAPGVSLESSARFAEQVRSHLPFFPASPASHRSAAQRPLTSRAVELPGAADYDVTLLETPEGWSSIAAGINNRGDVIGAIHRNNIFRAYLWSNGSAIDLGTPDGASTVAYLINERGQIAVDRQMLWDRGTLIDLGFVPSDINDQGDLVGTRFTTDHTSAILWRNGVLTDLGASFAQSSQAFAINARGQVVGTYAFGNNAALWDHGRLVNLSSDGIPWDINDGGLIVGEGNSTSSARIQVWKHGSPVEVPTGFGFPYIVWQTPQINDRGDIVGTVAELVDGPLSYIPHLFRTRNGVTTDAGIPGATHRGFNERGIAAGYIIPPLNEGTFHAFVWDDALEILAPPPGFAYGAALGINARGQVAGYVDNDSDPLGSRAVVWTPAHGAEGSSPATESSRHENAARVTDAGSRLIIRPFAGGRGVDLSIAQFASGGYAVRIVDIQGRVVRHWTGRSDGSLRDTWNGMRSDGTPADRGIYFVTVTGGGVRRTAKIVSME